MTAPSGHINGKDNSHSPGATPLSGDVTFGVENVKSLVAELEVPFDPAVIEWRVTNTSKDKKRGQIIPYADQRAYTDRLNKLFTPAGWTRKYTVHTSPPFEYGKDQKTVSAKVFVTCEVTIFGIGSHSATGEEWVHDPNAGTSAEAQAFKRSCACFGLGRYLYYFTGAWVDLDGNGRLKDKPQLFGWPTPQGWREGLRPPQVVANDCHQESSAAKAEGDPQRENGSTPAHISLVREIERMRETLGASMYRGLLRLARAWTADQIADLSLQRKTLERMQAAARGFRRLEAALERVNEATVTAILKSLGIRFIDKVDNLDTLHKLVLELEAAASQKR